jgi:hypothetical protein
MNNAEMRAEISKELKTARWYLIAVGILMFAMDLLIMYVLQKDQVTDEFRRLALIIDSVILAAFISLGLYVHKKPRFCLVTGLILFWAIQLLNAYDNPKALTQGIIMKVLFTMALVKGLQSASKATVLRKDLEKVFE